LKAKPMPLIEEGEADAVDRDGRNEGGQDRAREGEELERAGAKLRQRVRIRAELVVGEHLDLQPSARARLDALGGFVQAHRKRMRRRHVVADLVAEFGRVRRPGVDREQRQGRAASGKQQAAG